MRAGNQRTAIIRTELPWGHVIEVDSSETIGSAIVRLGVYDLAVTEALWRLTDRNDVALDLGANVGAMTSVLAVRCGRVWAFEPHPNIYRRLESNTRPWPGEITTLEVAVADRSGTGFLTLPELFHSNEGTAFLGEDGLEVQVERLDDLISVDVQPTIAKMDCEGAELDVLHGGRRVFESVRDLVFESHSSYPTDVTRFLEADGFQILRLERTLLRPVLSDPKLDARASWDAPNMLATRDPGRAATRFRRLGWRCLTS